MNILGLKTVSDKAESNVTLLVIKGRFTGQVNGTEEHFSPALQCSNDASFPSRLVQLVSLEIIQILQFNSPLYFVLNSFPFPLSDNLINAIQFSVDTILCMYC